MIMHVRNFFFFLLLLHVDFCDHLYSSKYAVNLNRIKLHNGIIIVVIILQLGQRQTKVDTSEILTQIQI